MDETITVRLGAKQVTLRAPDDVFARWEVQELGAQSLPRARGAALGLCLHGLDRPRVTPAQCRYDLAEYGAQVVRELLQRGIPKLHILQAGTQAYVLCARGVLTMDDIEAAAGNSDGEEGSPG